MIGRKARVISVKSLDESFTDLSIDPVFKVTLFVEGNCLVDFLERIDCYDGKEDEEDSYFVYRPDGKAKDGEVKVYDDK